MLYKLKDAPTTRLQLKHLSNWWYLNSFYLVVAVGKSGDCKTRSKGKDGWTRCERRKGKTNEHQRNYRIKPHCNHSKGWLLCFLNCNLKIDNLKIEEHLMKNCWSTRWVQSAMEIWKTWITVSSSVWCFEQTSTQDV